MTTWVLNTGNEQQTIPIAREGAPDVKVDSVFVQGKSKAKLESGYVVETNFLARNPNIKVKAVNAVVQTSQSQQQQQERDSRRTQFKKSENHPNV